METLNNNPNIPYGKDDKVKASDLSMSLIDSRIKVMIVDDEAIIRTGLNKILSEDIRITVAGEASSGEEAENLISIYQPDVVLMDISMPGFGGIEATKRILAKHTNIKILALSVHCDEHYPSKILRAGASGYITKGVQASEMIEAIYNINQGNKYICHSVAGKLKKATSFGRERFFTTLSIDEQRVCNELILASTCEDISQRLNIPLEKVEELRQSILDKLDIKNEVALVHLAIQSGILDRGDSAYEN